MNTSRFTGVYGKLPAHGDFVHRNLPANFINLLDEWLQSFISASQEQLGEDWLDIYLTSPLWRFVFSPGVIDQHQWAGVILPSVDRVGRYFPFSVATKIQLQTNPMEFSAMQTLWFEGVEQACLDALEGKVVIDDLVDRINRIALVDSSIYQPGTPSAALSSRIIVEMDFEEQSPAAVYPYLLDSFAVQAYKSYSAWSTRGSERISPCAFVSQGLPDIGGVAAMLDGQWAHWHWQQPHVLK